MKIFLLLTWTALAPQMLRADEASPPLPVIIQRVVARDENNQKVLQSMSYHEALHSEMLDTSGKVTKRQDVEMIVRPGAANEVQVLSARGDDLPTDPDQAAQKARGQAVKQQKMTFALKDMANRFNISRNGSVVYQGQETYVLAFEPRPGQPYRDQTEKVLNQLHGTMWISARDFSVLRTDATLAHPVEVAWFLAQISTLNFRYELHNTTGGMGPAFIHTDVVVDAPFLTIRQRMNIDMTQFEARSASVAGK